MSQIMLSGLSPDNPLGIRAAVGLLGVCERIYPGNCRLSWQPLQAVLHTRHACDDSQLVETLDADHRLRGMPRWLDWKKDIRVTAGEYCELLAASDRETQDVLAALAHEYNTDRNGTLWATEWRMFGFKERTGWLEAIREVAKSMTAEK